MSRRGVAILIKNGIDLNIIESRVDKDENILLLKCRIKNYEFVLGSVYGPNKDTVDFFNELKAMLLELNSNKVIIGGDWNLTPSADPPADNLDTYKMAAPPSYKRTEWFNEVCNSLGVVEIYRLMYSESVDYTYVPFGSMKKNRSRIDFFVISENLIPYVDRCGSSEEYCKKYFDHKPVLLTIGKDFKKFPPRINNRVLKHPLIYFVALLTTYEIYIRHLINIRYGVNAESIDNLCNNLDILDWKVCSLMKYCSPWDWTRDLSAEEVANRDILLSEATQIKERLLDLEELARLPRNVNDDEFFEILTEAIKVSVLKLQKDSLIAERRSKTVLSKELRELRKNFNFNYERIVNLENEMSGIMEREIADKVSNYIKDDILNFEKMTPRFLNIARIKKQDHLSLIKDANGKEFPGPVERGEFIKKFYMDLYRVPSELEGINFDGCVSRFLGPDICSNPIVAGMRISPDEQRALDGPITVDELDKAFKDSNFKSAPGSDGVSNNFIKVIWSLIRFPVLQYTEHCFRTGMLTSNFSTACIKLIPKKGDLSLIKNWRPISLLSCYYKIVSRVINHRLGTVVEKITGRGQKAYNGKRYIHEVILNLSMAIESCKNTGKSGVIISIDQQKAFDSVLHGFCKEAFKFFGFGEKFINMMSVLGDARHARVQLEDGILTDSFPLGRGRAQGDSPSPRQYNIAEQVFLLKIEFDPVISRLSYTPVIERPVPAYYVDANIAEEIFMNTGTEKTESFADDANIITEQKYECVYRVKELMDEFYLVSGLKCNVEKTSIMFIGPDNHHEQEKIRELGFMVVENFKCLGFEISRTGDQWENNWLSAQRRIRALIHEWNGYGLSTHGRVAVAKTFLISQLTYLGAILAPSNNLLNCLQEMIDNFVLRGTPWSRKTLYQPPDRGGLGMIKLSDFFIALKCSWLKRIFKEGINDNWRLNLMSKIFFKPICIRPHLLDPGLPLEYNIGSAIWQFLLTFWRSGKNLLYAPLMHNPLFIRGLDGGGVADMRVLDENIVGIRNYHASVQGWLSLRCADFLGINGLKSYDEVNENLDLIITPVAYMAIRRSIVLAFRKSKIALAMDTGKSLEALLLCKNKKSFIFRHWLTEAAHIEASGIKLIQKLCEITNIRVPDPDICEKNLGYWSNNFLPVNLKEFSLKLSRNSLPVNARLAARYRTVPDLHIDESCRLCRRYTGIGPTPRETFLHFFYECRTTGFVLEKFRVRYFNAWTVEEFRTALFIGTDTDDVYCVVIKTLMTLLLYEIWKSRNFVNRLPGLSTIECNLVTGLETMFMCSTKFKQTALKSGLFFFRKWWPAYEHGRG
jgi:exonuclease III